MYGQPTSVRSSSHSKNPVAGTITAMTSTDPESTRPRKVLLAEPRGFCAGVDMAIKALTWMVKIFDAPVYCYHEIVHNRFVVESFEAVGVVFVESIDEVPEGAPVMLSAHGSSPEVVDGAAAGAGVVIDAVCPLVTKVHHEVKKMASDDFDIIYIGHNGHDEAVGTVAEAPSAITLVEPETGLANFSPKDPSKVALFAQTTLGLHEWEAVLADAGERYPDLVTARKSDLCYATTNRQDAVRAMAKECDLILVVGSTNSSNTQALVRTAEMLGCAAYRVDSADAIHEAWLEECSDGRGHCRCVSAGPPRPPGDQQDRPDRRVRHLPVDRRRRVLSIATPVASVPQRSVRGGSHRLHRTPI